MPALDDAPQWAEQDACISVALEADSYLAEELTAIAGQLSEPARERFWVALAEELPRQERPAAAVLAALGSAALGPDS